MKLENLYFAPEDLFRLGNSSGPRLTNVRRPKDVDTTEINGICVVSQTGKAFHCQPRAALIRHLCQAGFGKLVEVHKCQ